MLLTKSELAKLLNISTRTIDRHRATGVDFGEVRLGGSIRFDPARVQRIIEQGCLTRRKPASRSAKSCGK